MNRRNHHRNRTRTLARRGQAGVFVPSVAVLTTLLLAGCGSTVAPPGHSDPEPGNGQSTSAPGDAGRTTGEPASTQAVVDPSAELVAIGIVMQSGADKNAELCVGGVAESYPPQCGGPKLAGEFSWDDVEATTEGDVRWTDNGYYAVGHLDLSTGGQGTFTLTRPLSQDPPEGMPAPDDSDGEGQDQFPQLCGDPTADVSDVDQDARTGGPAGMDEEQALMERLETMDGYVTSWVSDGGGTYNVVVTGDADAARAELRKVFTGPLCVEQRDLPTLQDVRAAQDAVNGMFEDLHLLSSGGGPGVLELEALVADQETVDQIHELVAEWLTPEQVRISSAFRELEG